MAVVVEEGASDRIKLDNSRLSSWSECSLTSTTVTARVRLHRQPSSLRLWLYLIRPFSSTCA